MLNEGLGIDWAAVSFEEATPVVLRTKPFRSIDEIKKAVAKRYRVTVADLEGPSHARQFALPRQVAMALAYRRLKPFGYSLPMVSKQFGGRHHTTALFACRKIGTKGSNPQGKRGPTRVMRAQLDKRAS